MTARQLLGASMQRVKRSLNDRRPSEYKSWISQSAKPGSAKSGDAVVSVLMATYNTPVDYLQKAIESVTSQSSPNWELCISDDKSTSAETLNFLTTLDLHDPRIRISFKSENSGISETLNDAITLATGNFVGVLDHDDALHPRAVELCLKAHEKNPHAKLIYSDEDKIDKNGKHSNPFFKPNFSPELLLSQMYLNHFTIMDLNTVKDLGGFRKEFDGAQDHDLALRFNLTEQNVLHIPEVLYHWRAWEESTARSIDAKPWAQLAAQRVQVEAMRASGLGGTSAPSKVKGLNEVHWNVPSAPKVGVVIPTASRRDPFSVQKQRLVDQCLDSLRTAAGHSQIEVCIVHTGPLEPDQEFVYRNSGYKLVEYDRDKFNFSHAVNLGVAALDTEYILLLNDDTRMIVKDSIDYMVEFAQNPQVGVVGAKLTFPSKKIQHAGIIFTEGLPTHPFYDAASTSYGYYGSLLTPRNFLAVTAAAAMVRRDLFNSVGGFDEDFAHDFNDVDFCLRIREKGFRNVWTPFAHFEHVEGASIVRAKANESESALFTSRYGEKYQIDPYYSPKLKQDIRHLYEYK